MFEIKYRDLDPDTGKVKNGIQLAIAQDESVATLICDLIEKEYARVEADGNRQFYIEYNPDLITVII